MNTPSNTDDTISSTDIIERIEELQNDLNDIEERAWGETQDEIEEEWKIGQAEKGDADPDEEFEGEDFEPLDLTDQGTVKTLPQSDDRDELLALLSLQEQAEYCPDWKYGETLIRDSYFQDYAQELAEDCGMTDREVKWPYTCIDWEQAARELQYDYTSVDYDGVTYWIRCG